MILKKTLFTLSAIFCLALSSYAQSYFWWLDGSEIATDYNTCLQGVKDSTGAWIIQPQYENIEHEGARYIVQAGGRYGLIDRNGKVMIPPMYDFLYNNLEWYAGDALENYYHATFNGKAGVVDSVNNVIVPFEYEFVRSYYDSSFVAKKGKRTYDFYNIHGTRFECPWKSKKLPDHEGYHGYVMKRRAIGGYKYGLVNDSGRIVLKRKFDDINGRNENRVYKISDGNHYGYCSSAGKMIWPMVFSDRYHDNFSYDLANILADVGIGPANYKGKIGLIKLNGDTVLPFEYDYIGPFGYYDEYTLWEVRKDSLSGIYDINKGWLLQPTCSFVYNIATFINEKDSTTSALLVAKQNGKWGAMTTSGQGVVPFECTDLLWLESTSFIFQKGDSLLALSMTRESDRNELVDKVLPERSRLFFFWYDHDYERPRRFIPPDNQYAVFHGKDGVRAFYNPGKTKDSTYNDSVPVSLSTGNYYGMKVPDSIIVSSVFQVIPVIKPNEHFELFDIYGETYLSDDDSTTHYPAYFVVRNHAQPNLTTISNRTSRSDGESIYYITGDNDLLKSDGQILLSGDSLYDLNIDHHYNDGSIYFRHYRYFTHFENCAYDTNGKIICKNLPYQLDDFTSKYSWTTAPGKKSYEHQLIDNATLQNLLGKKVYSDNAYPIWDSITIVATEKNGVRLFNINQRKYLSPKGYDQIIPLRSDGTLFGVKTCTWHIGVVDVNGAFVLDTIYDALTTVEYKDGFWYGGSQDHAYFGQMYKKMVFYNDSGMVLLDIEKGKIISHEDAVPVLWNIVAGSVPYKELDKTLNDSLYKYIRDKEHISAHMYVQDSIAMLPWQKQSIVDSIYWPKREIWPYSMRLMYHCDYCRKGNTWGYGIDWSRHTRDNYRHLVRFRSDSLLCFSQFTTEYGSRLEHHEFSTVMMFKDGAHQMKLDSIFNPTSDWRNFLINTLINYVNSHQGIEGDCHNPAGIPLLLSESFQLTPEGIILYPPDFREQGIQLVITIPWSDADRYLRDDIRTRLPINAKK